MREELQEILISLAKWCKKYNKNYATMCFTDGNSYATIDVEDKDKKECDIYIEESQLEEILNKEEL